MEFLKLRHKFVKDMIVNEISLVIQNIISEIQMIKREITGK